MDVLALSRWQFAITTIYHFLFVPLTLGLSIFIALLETCSIWTKHEEWRKTCRQMVRFFGTVFLINFAMGVVTGIVQEFHFGMNWSEYSRFMGDIFGAPLALEALTAFFLESTFLGIWLFGWDRLSPKLHCACIWLVAFASNLSAFWILVANSFMQHPVGFVLRNGRAEMTDFTALITNPYAIGQYTHTLFSGIVTSGMLILAVCAYKILQGEAMQKAFERVLQAAAVYTLAGLFAVMGTGHLQAQQVAHMQPMKLAAMEALWQTENPAPFAVMAVIDTEKQQNSFELNIPYMLSMLVYNQPSGEIKGISELQQTAEQTYGPGDYKPDIPGLFVSFRGMAGLGGLMLLISLSVGFLAWKKRLAENRLLLKLVILALPLPFLANSLGWYLTEAGRQPWIVVGLQKTASAFSPNLTSGEVFLTLSGFTIIYLVLAAAAIYAALRFIRRNPAVSDEGRDF